MTHTAEERAERLQTIVAFMIAAITVIGALISWRAAVADDGAGDADFAGLRAAINLEEARSLNTVNALEHYSAFADYQRQSAIAAGLEAAAETDPAAAAQVAEANDLLVAKQQNFPNKFLNRDGSYGLQREMGELFADAAKQKDLNPDPQFAEADAMREKTRQLLIAVMVLGIALVCYTLIELVGSRAQLALLGIGTLLGVAATAYAVYIDLVAR